MTGGHVGYESLLCDRHGRAARTRVLELLAPGRPTPPVTGTDTPEEGEIPGVALGTVDESALVEARERAEKLSTRALAQRFGVSEGTIARLFS